ncbi:MAG: OmpA family protein [Alphaproteobacteria bacterium]|nr:OmpA family protein [Alphaproteobacteria bacterium]
MNRPGVFPRKSVRPNHSDDWLMTYADLITLLLCFFALFLSISMPKMYEKVHEPVGNKPALPQLEQPPVQRQAVPLMLLPDDNAVPLGTVIARVEITKEETPVVAEAPAAPPELEDLPPVQQTAPAEDVLPPPEAPLVEGGDRLTTIEMSSAAVFALGSATLSPEGGAMLADVARQLKAAQFSDYMVTVEGHTDDNPVETPQFPSNWELSTARAAAVVRYFLEQGINPQKLRAAGYAETFPKLPNRDAAGNAIPENQAQNRRVVIKLEKVEKAG